MPELILCTNCGKEITNKRTYYRAGNNGSIYCERECAYHAYEGFYTRRQVDKTIQKIERKDDPVNEKWVTFTANDTHFMFDIHLVSRLERQLKEEGQAYRTIFYRNNKPTKYVVGKGYVVMSRKEENAIIESVQG